MLDEFYLGIDYGHKKTGLAIAQNIIKKSRPLKVLYNDYILEISKVLDDRNITKIIIGYPYHNEESKIHDDIKSFIEELKSVVSSSIEIIVHDEQLSSESAKASFAEMRNRGLIKKKNSDYDDISASIILQSWINENIID